jgi:hypothetical protein
MGGLGNQMFQISNAYAQSLKHKKECFFRPYSETPNQGNQTTIYVDNIFKNLIFKDDLNGLTRYNEPDWSYNEKNINIESPVEFYGYYQSSKNFLGYDEEIRKLFLIDDENKKFLLEKYPELKQENTLSIHVRRGDYKKYPLTHPTISKSYLEKSLEEIGGYSHVFILSDDKNWVTENLNLPNSTIVDEKDYLELWLMSLCQNHILSSSSFSWWGSFLNKKDNKKVIAPSMWFGPNGPKNYKDIYQNDWTVIDVSFTNGELTIK